MAVQFDRRMGGTKILTSYPHRHGAMYCVSQLRPAYVSLTIDEVRPQGMGAGMCMIK